MDKWEYCTIQLQPKQTVTGKHLKRTATSWDAACFSEQLNSLGKNGWELVSCFCTEASVIGQAITETGGTNGIFAAFKRKLQ